MNAISLDAIQITAHRGFSLNVPENTIPAIERAIEEKADHIEVDVRSTKDGELVLLHDASLRRTTGLKQMIWDVNYADVRIPTLREVFKLAKGEANINIDLKHGGDSNDVVRILNIWTVNTKSVIERVSRLGVDNIITDNPIYAREVRYRSNSDSYLVTLLKIVIE